MNQITSPVDYAMAQITKAPSGFVDNTLITMTYDWTTRKITATSSSGIIEIIENRQLYSYTNAQFAAIMPAHDAGVSNTCYFLIFQNGVLSWSETPWIFSQVQVAIVCWNPTVSATKVYKGFMLKEDHGLMDWESHEEAHLGLGTLLISGGEIADYTLNSTTEANQAFSVAATVIKDEDIDHSLATLPADGSDYVIMYRNGTGANNFTWVDTGNTIPYIKVGGTLAYNQKTAGGDDGTYQMTALNSNTQRVNYYLLACPNGNTGRFRYFLIPGQTLYTTLSAAQAENFALLKLGDLKTKLVETYPCVQITMKRDGASTSVIEAVANIRGTRNSIVTGGAITGLHSSLSGRSDLGQHPLAAIEAISADKVIVSKSDGAGGFNIGETTTTTTEINKLNSSAGNAFKLVGFDSAGDTRVDGDDAHILALGSTAKRPGGADYPAITPLNGMIRYNTDLQIHESYRGTSPTGVWACIGSRYSNTTLDPTGDGTLIIDPSLFPAGITCSGYEIKIKIVVTATSASEVLKIYSVNDNGTWKASVISVCGTDTGADVKIDSATGALYVDGVTGTAKVRVDGFTY